MTTWPYTQGRAASGFSLLEMLVVLAIIALVTAFAMPLVTRPPDGLRLDAAARDLADALRLTRAAAIAHNAEVALAIDVDRRTFESPVVPTRRFPGDVLARLKIAEPERAQARGSFRFFPDGSSTGGDVALVLHGKEVRICVDWVTGIPRQAANC
jgi:general secretion pathway protein H